jgi:hypothetical protein
VRLIFTALLLLNVAFFGWARWIDMPARSSGPAALDASLPTLELVRVTSPSVSATAPSGSPLSASAAAGGGAATSMAAPLRCRSIGPFEDDATASAAAERLQARGWNAHARNVENASPDGYWVFVGNLTAAAQRHLIATLNAAGIRDAAVMSQPEQSDRVSVGVFADQAHAVRRAEQVRALGFKPTLQVHQRSITQRWLDIELKTGDVEPSAPEVLKGTAQPDGSAPGAVQIADCPTTSARG